MKKIQTETKAEDAAKATAFVTKLNRYRHKLIPLNPAEGINLPKTVESKPYHTRNTDSYVSIV